jgi:SAM-dependent methyltransferase
MTQPDDKTARSYAYSGTFLTPERAAKYGRKFEKRIEIIRHDIEVDILNRHARGRLFDCSVGSGRFIPELKAVTSFEGMDYSPAFVEMVRRQHPQVKIARGDLLEGIAAESDAYDTVMCLRTLPQMTRMGHILAEMTRLAKPGGLVIIDYGRPEATTPAGEEPAPGQYDIAGLAAALPLELVAEHHLDSPLVRAVKKRRALYRLFHHRVNLVPNGVYRAWEEMLSRLSFERVLYVLRKKASLP